MADDSAIADDRPSSPEAQTRFARRERRKSGSKSPATAISTELKPIPPPKKRQSQFERHSYLPGQQEDPTAGPSTRNDDELLLSAVPSSSTQQGQKLVFRRPRLPSHAEGDDEAATKRDLNIVLHDISQSMWIEDPKDHSMEKVYLTTEAAALEQMLTIDTSFSWM